MERSNCWKPQHLTLTSTLAAIFIAFVTIVDFVAWKNISGSYLNLFNYFLHFRLLVSNTKNQIGTMISFRILLSFILAKTPKSIWNNFYNVFIQISVKIQEVSNTERHTWMFKKITYNYLVLDLTKLDFCIGEMMSNSNSR